jgi:hypothetical protein
VTDLLEDTDTVILTELFDEDAVPCEYGDCTRPASWAFVCGECGVGRELVCQEHYVLINDPVIDYQMVFNNTCGHLVYASHCRWVPFG